MTEGDKAWILLACYVVTWDMVALLGDKETLSSSFARALDSPVRRWPTIAAWGYLTAHLFKAIPEKYDPLRRVR